MLNVLKLALPQIGLVAEGGVFEWRRYISDSVNDFGVVISTYTNWSSVKGSVQPLDATLIDLNGIEGMKRGITVWANIDFKTLETDGHCDQVRYRGKIYNCTRCTNWNKANGWGTFACTEDKYQESTDGNEY